MYKRRKPNHTTHPWKRATQLKTEEGPGSAPLGGKEGRRISTELRNG